MDSSTAPRTTDTTPARTSRRAPAGWQLVLGATAAATLVNLLILLAGNIADASFTLTQDGEVYEVGAAGVLFGSALPVAVGLAAALLLARWKPVFLRVAQYVGGALAVLTLGGVFGADDGGTGVALALMHLVAGAVVVAALEARRRTS